MGKFEYDFKPGELNSQPIEGDFVGGYRTDFTNDEANDTIRFRSLIRDADYGNPEGNSIQPGEVWQISVQVSFSQRNFDNFVLRLVGDSAGGDDGTFTQKVSRLSSAFDDGSISETILVTYEMVEPSFREDVQVRMTMLDATTSNIFLSYQAVRVKKEAQTTAIFSVDDDSGENFD